MLAFRIIPVRAGLHDPNPVRRSAFKSIELVHLRFRPKRPLVLHAPRQFRCFGSFNIQTRPFVEFLIPNVELPWTYLKAWIIERQAIGRTR